MFQMARDGDVPGLETLLKRLGPPKSARVVSKLNTLGTIHILRKHLYKGQIISECIYEIIDFPKNDRRLYRLGKCDLL